MILVTFCFYENPAALHEIKAWENLKFSEIIYKKKCSDNIIEYHLKNDEQFEILYCLPQTKVNHLNLEHHFCNQVVEDIKYGKKKYKKTLLFGKFNSSELSRILKFVEKIEKYANEQSHSD